MRLMMSVTLVSQGILSLEMLLAADCQEVQQQSTVYALSPLHWCLECQESQTAERKWYFCSP